MCQYARQVAAAVFMLLLAACGGGGGASNASTSQDSGSGAGSSPGSSAPASSAPASSAPASSAPGSSAVTDVVTYKYDVARSGLNPNETVLTPANVNQASFGLLHNLQVDGKVDAQPLYLTALSIAGVSHNVVFVATENDSVYAFDADSGSQLWKVSLLGSGETVGSPGSCDQISPSIGITATPVIDRSAGAHGVIYLVATSQDSSQNFHHRLHALDVTTGAEVAPAPVAISATYGSTSFVPSQYAERAALLLSGGNLYLAWTSHCDDGSYGGWVMAYNEASLSQVAVINLAAGASPTGSGYASEGPSIWMSGGGLAADSSGNVYLLTANGVFDTTLNGSGFPSAGDYGNSFVKLSLQGSTLSVADYFTLNNTVSESQNDEDLGSGGIMLLPDLTDSSGTVQHLAVGAGKDGNIYVVNRDNMGKFTSAGNSIYQQLSGASGGQIFSNPAWFNGMVYYGPVSGSLRALAVTSAMMSGSPAAQTSTNFARPGTSPVVSASGTSNGIVWAHENTDPAVLHAYNAADLTELYNSSQAASNRDQFGSGNKFIVPVVTNGKVFVGSTNSVAVFGLLQ